MMRFVDWGLLRGLSDDERRALLANARRRKYTRRQVIFHEGDPGDSVHLVDKGHVSISQTTPLGETAMIRVLGPGEFFGELVLLSPGARSAMACALEYAETLSLHRDVFDEFRQRHASAQAALIASLADEIRRLAGALTEALCFPADTRVWRRLAALCDLYGADDSNPTIPLTQVEIGQLAGVTRPTANRLLREAEHAGALSLSRGQVVVSDRAWLARRAR